MIFIQGRPCKLILDTPLFRSFTVGLLLLLLFSITFGSEVRRSTVTQLSSYTHTHKPPNRAGEDPLPSRGLSRMGGTFPQNETRYNTIPVLSGLRRRQGGKV